MLLLEIAGGVLAALFIWAGCRYIFGDPWRDYFLARQRGENPKEPSFFRLIG